MEGSEAPRQRQSGVELVIPEAEMLQRGDLRVKALDLLNLVIEQGEILELGERVQTLDLRDPVEAEVELLEVHEVVQILDPGRSLLSSLSLVSFSNAPRYWILQMFLKLYETARASRSSVAARFAAMDSSVRPVICGGESGGQSCPVWVRVGDGERDESGFAHPLTSRPA